MMHGMPGLGQQELYAQALGQTQQPYGANINLGANLQGQVNNGMPPMDQSTAAALSHIQGLALGSMSALSSMAGLNLGQVFGGQQ
jgi:hypothetical protein